MYLKFYSEKGFNHSPKNKDKDQKSAYLGSWQLLKVYKLGPTSVPIFIIRLSLSTKLRIKVVPLLHIIRIMCVLCRMIGM